jgi:hypothetical protein
VEPFRLYGTAVADSYTLRRLSANAVRFRLGKQLDWRLDLMLDATGMHILSLRSIYVLSEDRETDTIFDLVISDDGTKEIGEMREPRFEGEYVVRSEVMLKIPYTIEPVIAQLDLRLRDFMSLTEVPMQKPLKGGGPDKFDLELKIGDMMPDDASPTVARNLERAEIRRRIKEPL